MKIGEAAAYLAQRLWVETSRQEQGLLFGKALGIALLTEHFEHAHAQVGTLGLPGQTVAQNTQGLIEAPVGDIDACPVQGVGGRRGFPAWHRRRLGALGRRGFRYRGCCGSDQRRRLHRLGQHRLESLKRCCRLALPLATQQQQQRDDQQQGSHQRQDIQPTAIVFCGRGRWRGDRRRRRDRCSRCWRHYGRRSRGCSPGYDSGGRCGRRFSQPRLQLGDLLVLVGHLRLKALQARLHVVEILLQ
ncbi:hypothetical protein AO269_11610 [Pseudomonas putida]|nr:hypothetical protein AO269_11610 [Pseudomonas putida]